MLEYFLWEAEFLDLDFQRDLMLHYMKTVTSVKGHQTEKLVDAMKAQVLDEEDEDLDSLISGRLEDDEEDESSGGGLG